MRETRIEQWAPSVGAIVTAGVGWVWCGPVLGYGGPVSLAAGLVAGLLVFAALCLALRGKRGRVGSRKRVLVLVATAGCLMAASSLPALLLPGVVQGALPGTIAIGGAVVLLAAVLFELAWARRSGRGR